MSRLKAARFIDEDSRHTSSACVETHLGKRARQPCVVSQEYPSCDDLTLLSTLSIHQNCRAPVESPDNRLSKCATPGGRRKELSDQPESLLTLREVEQRAENNSWGWFIDDDEEC